MYDIFNFDTDFQYFVIFSATWDRFAHVNSTFTPTKQFTPYNRTRMAVRSSVMRGRLLDHDFKSIRLSYISSFIYHSVINVLWQTRNAELLTGVL